ncbi:kinase-like domain-containing protein, partial [Mycena pura]
MASLSPSQLHIKVCDDPDLLSHERLVYTWLGPHPRIVKCLNPSLWSLPVDTRIKASETEPLSFPKAPHGDLEQYLKAHPDVPARLRIKWARQIAEGIAFIHSRRIAWADCTPANLLLDANLDILLCDFGGSGIDGARSRVILPGRYCDPHVDYSSDYLCGPKVDIFAFGCVFLEILTYNEADTVDYESTLHRGAPGRRR